MVDVRLSDRRRHRPRADYSILFSSSDRFAAHMLCVLDQDSSEILERGISKKTNAFYVSMIA